MSIENPVVGERFWLLPDPDVLAGLVEITSENVMGEDEISGYRVKYLTEAPAEENAPVLASFAYIDELQEIR